MLNTWGVRRLLVLAIGMNNRIPIQELNCIGIFLRDAQRDVYLAEVASQARSTVSPYRLILALQNMDLFLPPLDEVFLSFRSSFHLIRPGPEESRCSVSH